MKGLAELRRRVERLDDIQLERALEAALSRDYRLAERIVASAPAPLRPRRRDRPATRSATA